MAKVLIDHVAIEGLVFDRMVKELDEIGKEAKSFAKSVCPVRTGFAKRSIFYVVLDERGNVLAGDTSDENGYSIPNYLPSQANGRLRVFLGANAPYFIWIEIGARGRPGKAIIARAAELMSHRLAQLAHEGVKI